jgi:hypothetical protein
MTPFQNINIPVEPFLTQPSVEITDYDKNHHWLISADIFNTEFLSYLKTRNIVVGNSNVLFYTPPNGHLGIHVDGDRLHNRSMLNYVWGSSNHSMSWYELNSGVQLTSRLFTNGDKYISIPENNVTKICDHTVGYPTLVKVGIPHSVVNYSDTGRWCLSIDLQIDSGPGIDFDQAIKLLKD